MKCTHTQRHNVYLSDANESLGTPDNESPIRCKVKQVQIILWVPPMTDPDSKYLH